MRTRSTRIPILVAGGLIALSVAASACGDTDAGDPDEVPEEAAQVIDDHRDAWVNQDVDAFYASITDDFFRRSYYYGTNTHTLWED